jgi:hypothetical protein
MSAIYFLDYMRVKIIILDNYNIIHNCAGETTQDNVTRANAYLVY